MTSELSVYQMKQWLEDRYCPTVLVQCTDDVEQICLKNALRFIDLLRPFESVYKEIYTRTVKEFESYPIKNFRIRFRGLDDLSTENLENDKTFQSFISDTIRASLSSTQETVSSPEMSSNGTFSKYSDPKATMSRDYNYTPWFDFFREEYLLSIRANDHETFEHPVACLCAVSTSNPDPIKALRSMYNPDKPPEIFKELGIDPDIFRFYVLIHDQSTDQNDKKTQDIFRKMKEELGATICRLVQLNSSSLSTSPSDEPAAKPSSPLLDSKHSPDIWSNVLPKYDLYKRRKENLLNETNNFQFGKYLTVQDTQYLSIIVDEFICNGVVPHLERKIRHINSTIVVKKKSLKSTLSSIFARKPNTKEQDTGKLASVGAENLQIRKMADLAMMLRDYDTAQSCYKIISNEYKNNRNSKHYAAVQEITSYLFFITNNAPRKDIETALDIAYMNYKSVKEKYCAFRCAMLQALIYKNRQEYRRAAESFLRCCSVDENNFFKAALLFEQTAYCYTSLDPPMFRKFSFFMVLAGYRYSHSNQIMHSYRCYNSSLKMYYRKDWDQIFEHVTITMGRLSNFMGNLKASVSYMHDFMCNCTQLPENQKAFMTEFVATVTEYIATLKTKKLANETVPSDSNSESAATVSNTNSEDAEVEDLFKFLELPNVDASSIRILLKQYGEHTYTDELPNPKWRKLEETLVRAQRGQFHMFKWDNLHNLKSLNSRIEDSVVGEPIFVEVEIKNPLFIPIELTNIHLVADFEETSANTKTNTTEEEETKTEDEEQQTNFVVEKVNITIQAGRREWIKLKIEPLKPNGMLRIRGMKWTLQGVMSGMVKFQLQGRRLNDTKQHRAGKFYEQDNRLNIRVVERMPLLEAEIIDLPSHIWSGELLECKLVLKNSGQRALKNVALRISHPNMISIGKANTTSNQLYQSIPMEISEQFLQQTGVGSIKEQWVSQDLSIMKLFESADMELLPQQSLTLPLYIRGGKASLHNLFFLFYYEPVLSAQEQAQDKTKFLPFRLARTSYTLKVTESVSTNVFCQTSSQNFEEHIIGLEVKNLRGKESVDISQITSISPVWTMKQLNLTNRDVFTVPPQTTTVLYFSIKKRQQEMDATATGTLPSLYHTTYLLNYKEREGVSAVVDTKSSTCLEFLFRDYPSFVKATKVYQQNKLSELKLKLDPKSQSDVLKTLPPYQSQDHFTVLSSHGFNMMVFWKGNDKQQHHFGQSNIRNAQFLPQKDKPVTIHPASTFPSGNNLYCPLRFSLRYPDFVNHNFEYGKMVQVPVVFEVANVSPNQLCDFVLELLPPLETPLTNDSRIYSKPYLWMGNTRVTFKEVKPFEVRSIPSVAVFLYSGTYNLNQFRLFWKIDTDAYNLMTVNDAQYLICLNPTSEEKN